jgi:hypothetical protein
MRPSNRIAAVFSGIIVLALTGCILLLKPIDAVRAGTSVEEVLYIPSPAAIKRLSLGYTGLVADIYWTRAVQYFGGRHHSRAVRYDLLYPYLDVTTTLDPKLLIAYDFGSMFLSQPPPDGAGQPDKAIELVERGIQANPNQWRLYYNLGFIYYDLKDYQGAQKAFERGSHVPGAHPALSSLAAAMAQKAGDRETSRLLWTQIYNTTQDEQVKANVLKRLAALKIQDDVAQLEHLVDVYRQQTGRMPTNFDEMVAAGWLRSLPKDPTGAPYKLRENGTVEITNQEMLRFLN